ncbi:MAG: acyl-CoA dehydrogenase [Lautropia sp.]|nr:acyl-CoA dehydrogenase [Lautropia sp.]
MKRAMVVNRNLDFLLYEWLNVGALCQRPRYSARSREDFDEALMQASTLADETLAPINRLLDEQEPRLHEEGIWTPPQLKAALDRVYASGLLGLAHDEAIGGRQLPAVIEKAAGLLLDGGSVAASAYLLPSRAGSRLLLQEAEPALAERYVGALLRGEATCTFCVSEPQAGSSLADVRTRAVRQPDGSFRLYGHKMWVVGGDHELTGNIVHLVLAKIEDEVGDICGELDCLSLFVVPKYLPDTGTAQRGERNDVVAAGLNLQMGQRGASSCLLSLGDGYHLPQGQAGAVGWLLGQENQGMALIAKVFPQVLLEVGLATVALSYAGYVHSLAYARERYQGRIPGRQSPGGGQVPIIEHADIRRMLMLQKVYAEGGLALGLWCARLIDDQEAPLSPAAALRAKHLLALLAPVMKCWMALYGMRANSLAVQVLGSYGYTRDYPVEQFYRDNRLHAIVEGTHGILSMELLREQLLGDDAQGMQYFFEVVNKTMQRAAARCGDGRHMGVQLGKYAERFGWVMERLRQEPDLSRCLANASIFMEAFGHYVIAWVWLEQWLVAEVAFLSSYGAERNFYAGKCHAARFFFQHELPVIESKLNLLEQMDMSTVEMQPEWF